jgi:hypothetical protein
MNNSVVTQASQSSRRQRNDGGSSAYDKPTIGGSPTGRRALVASVVACLAAAAMRAPSQLCVTISEFADATLRGDALSEANLFRKQYGNLQAAFAAERAAFEAVFVVDGNVLRLRSLDSLHAAAAAAGNACIIDAGTLAECERLWTAKAAEDIRTLRVTRSNECVNCGGVYKEAIVWKPLCTGSGGGKTQHVPRYDFSDAK